MWPEFLARWERKTAQYEARRVVRVKREKAAAAAAGVGSEVAASSVSTPHVSSVSATAATVLLPMPALLMPLERRANTQQGQGGGAAKSSKTKQTRVTEWDTTQKGVFTTAANDLLKEWFCRHIKGNKRRKHTHE